MGLFTKIFKVTTTKADDLLQSKSVRKAAAQKASQTSRAIKDFTNKNTLKTTSAVANQGVSQATAGGVKASTGAARNFAKGAGTTAKVGGRVIAGTAIAGVPTITGLGLYNYYKDSTSLTDEDRRLDFLLDKQREAQEIANNTGNATTPDSTLLQDPTSYGNTGVGGSAGGFGAGSFDPFMEAYSGNKKGEEEEDSGIGVLGMVLGIAAVGGGGYYLYKQSKKKGKK
jgi:hypothetical protein